MSLRYKGAVLSTVPPTTSTTVAPGIWTLEQQYLAQGASAWPEVLYPSVFQNVSLLLTGDGTNGAQNNTFLDSSGNNYTVTRSIGAATQGTFSPYGTLWSNYFDGAGDYLSVPANAAFNFGTGNFTVEFWINFNSTSGIQTVYDCNYGTAPNITFQNSGAFMVAYINGTSVVLASSVADTVGTWIHYACVRNGTAITLYRNGTSVASATYSGNVGNSSVATYIGGSAGGGGYYVNGYISNLRVVKGTAVYTSAFTPSTTPLTAVSGTSLLTCQSNRFIDNSANNFAITPAGDVSVQRFSPFKPTSAYDAATIGASGSFSGSDVLSAGTGTNFDLGTGNFCMESWFYSINGANAGLISKRQSVNVGGWTFTSIRLAGLVGSTWLDPIVGASGSTSTKGQWTHVVATRSGTAFRFFTNGVLTGYSTYSGAIQQMTAHNLVFGNAGTTIEGPLTGYMTDSRLTVGSIPAAYTTSTTTLNTQVFTPPTSPIASSTGTILLKYQNAGIPDAAMMNDIQTAGNVQVSTSVKKYGTGSLAFDGTGDYLTSAPYPASAFGTGDFTIEFWVNPTALGTNVILDYRPASTTGVYITLVLYSDRTALYVNEVEVITGAVLSTGTWTYLTLCRASGSTKLYLNGVQSGSTYADTNNYIYSANRPRIGASGYNGALGFNGYIDDLRITNGVALYTENFTPPTKALPTY